MISVVIPTMTVSSDLEVMAVNCAKSYKEFADELIIVEDGGRWSRYLAQIADIYIYHKENLGFTANVNMGWKLETKDFTFIVNSDTYIESGNFKDLCIPGKVTSPKMAGHLREQERLNGAFFVVPREVKAQRGVLNERYKMYYSDDDYYERIKDIFSQVNSVVIRHVYGATTSELGDKWRDAESTRDKILFEEESVKL